MWLLPFLDRVAAFAARTYYRLTVAGGPVPAAGPVLLVANHPNSLFDPALVAAVAGRPVRFLAKAPLFTHPAVGWLVRGSGAIPVYRTSDDPAQVHRNEEAFRAAYAALAEGAAVGIFPEGISHDLPALAPLKTGAARIALGAARHCGGAFPIVPVGLTFRGKQRFRSEALALVGEPVPWADLAREGVTTESVRELTRRIEGALRNQTLNLASWEDAPLVEWAVAIYAAAYGARAAPAERVRAEREAAAALAYLRAQEDSEWAALAREVARHARVLRTLGLRPADLAPSPGYTAALRWTARQAAFLLLTGVLGVFGSVLFYPPYRLTGLVVARIGPTPDSRSTYLALGGALFFTLWIVLLAAAAAVLGGVAAGVGALLLLPAVALVTLAFRDRWADTRAVARRFLLLRGRAALRRELAERQQRLAERLRRLRERTLPALRPAPPLA
jgi:glycerol-3-phosphate O-acyltransferase/dihydroxyacetone phosphate acyltransferase